MENALERSKTYLPGGNPEVTIPGVQTSERSEIQRSEKPVADSGTWSVQEPVALRRFLVILA